MAKLTTNMAGWLWMAVLAALVVSLIGSYMSLPAMLAQIAAIVLGAIPAIWIIYKVWMKKFQLSNGDLMVFSLVALAAVGLGSVSVTTDIAGLVGNFLDAVQPLALGVAAGFGTAAVVGGFKKVLK